MINTCTKEDKMQVKDLIEQMQDNYTLRFEAQGISNPYDLDITKHQLIDGFHDSLLNRMIRTIDVDWENQVIEVSVEEINTSTPTQYDDLYDLGDTMQDIVNITVKINKSCLNGDLITLATKNVENYLWIVSKTGTDLYSLKSKEEYKEEPEAWLYENYIDYVKRNFNRHSKYAIKIYNITKLDGKYIMREVSKKGALNIIHEVNKKL